MLCVPAVAAGKLPLACRPPARKSDCSELTSPAAVAWLVSNVAAVVPSAVRVTTVTPAMLLSSAASMTPLSVMDTGSA